MHSFWNHVEAWKSSFSKFTVNVTHASFFNVYAIKMIKRVIIRLPWFSLKDSSSWEPSSASGGYTLTNTQYSYSIVCITSPLPCSGGCSCWSCWLPLSCWRSSPMRVWHSRLKPGRWFQSSSTASGASDVKLWQFWKLWCAQYILFILKLTTSNNCENQYSAL